jgi:pyrroline-5-carboxylate reductase
MKISIIGFGNMGQTYVNSFLNSGFVQADNIFFLNKREVEKKKVFGIPKEYYFVVPNVSFFE